MSWRWGPHTLRARLTLWYMAVMLAVLGVYVSVVLALVARNLSGALDARLRSDFRWAAEMAEQGPDGSLSWFEGDPWSADGPWLQVWSPAGRLIYRTSVAARLPAPASEALVDRADGRIRALPGDPAPFRILGARATVGGQPVVIQVGRSEAFMRLEVRELALLLLLGLPLTVAVAGAGGYLLARGALSPLQRMAGRARAITAARLDERLPIDSPRDELGRLAAVFNDTLGRLESSFKQMRQFTADVSHELRTPLTAIRSVGEVGLREPRDARAYEQVIQSMLEETDRLTRLIDRLLLVSRADRGDLPLAFRPVGLGALADEVAAHLGVLAEEKRQSLTVEHAASPCCRGDRIALRAGGDKPRGQRHPLHAGRGRDPPPRGRVVRGRGARGERHRSRHSGPRPGAALRPVLPGGAEQRVRRQRSGALDRQVGGRGQSWSARPRANRRRRQPVPDHAPVGAGAAAKAPPVNDLEHINVLGIVAVRDTRLMGKPREDKLNSVKAQSIGSHLMVDTRLHDEFEYYLEHQAELAAKCRGRYIVIESSKVLGDYETAEEAVRATAPTHEPGTFPAQRLRR